MLKKIIEINRTKLSKLIEKEKALFEDKHQHSKALFEQAQESLLAGVPMSWMVRWAGGFPVFVREGKGAYFTDVDGNRYLDLCLGDTGAMTGHANEATVQALIAQARHGFTFMLPNEDAIHVSRDLAQRFGLPFWQIVLTATDANRFALKLAREITERSRILVFNYCYHGTVDETFASLYGRKIIPRRGSIGYPINPAFTTRVVEFNDVRALEEALAQNDVACVLAEPVMTNIGIIHPEPGFHDALRELTRKTGTLLVIDETHTISSGPGGYTAAHGLQPDMLTIGKPIGGGMPCAAYGMTAEVADRIRKTTHLATADVSGIGGTLSGNALAMAAMKATLQQVLTADFFAKTIPLATRFTHGVEGVIAEFGLPWIVKQLGCRAEYWFRPHAPVNGSEAAAAHDDELDQYMHLFALNRGILLTPFHNMALICADVTDADIDLHTQVFRDAVVGLLK